MRTHSNNCTNLIECATEIGIARQIASIHKSHILRDVIRFDRRQQIDVLINSDIDEMKFLVMSHITIDQIWIT